MRLFIAIRFSRTMINSLRSIQTQWRAQGVRGSYTKPENLHLTLAFLGEYPNPEQVMEVLRGVPFRSFPLHLEGCGQFGNLYWAGVTGQEALEKYVRDLRQALAAAEIPFDEKRFRPHITLVRRGPEKAPPVPVPETEMTVRRISLMRSDRNERGMVYTELSSVSAEE